MGQWPPCMVVVLVLIAALLGKILAIQAENAAARGRLESIARPREAATSVSDRDGRASSNGWWSCKRKLVRH